MQVEQLSASAVTITCAPSERLCVALSVVRNTPVVTVCIFMPVSNMNAGRTSETRGPLTSRSRGHPITPTSSPSGTLERSGSTVERQTRNPSSSEIPRLEISGRNGELYTPVEPRMNSYQTLRSWPRVIGSSSTTSYENMQQENIPPRRNISPNGSLRTSPTVHRRLENDFRRCMTEAWEDEPSR